MFYRHRDQEFNIITYTLNISIHLQFDTEV